MEGIPQLLHEKLRTKEMDELLSSMGVVKDKEEDILAKVLYNHQTEQAKIKKPKHAQQQILTNIAHSLIDNKIPERVLSTSNDQNLEDGEVPNTVGQKSSSSSSSAIRKKIMSSFEDEEKSNRPRTKLVSTQTLLEKKNKDKEALGSSKVNTDSINHKLLQTQAFKTASLGTQYPAKPSKPLHTPQPRVVSTKTTKRKHVENEYQCPICSQSFTFNNEEQMSKHIDRCSRRQTTSSRHTTNDEMMRYDSDASWINSDDDKEQQEEEEVEDFNGITSKSKAKRKKITSKQSRKVEEEEDALLEDEDDVFLPTSSSEEEVDEEDWLDEDIAQALVLDETGDLTQHTSTSSSTHMIIADDWEEMDYKKRLKRLQQHQDRDGLDRSMTATGYHNTQIETHLWQRLYAYQQEGCQWLYGLYRDGMGGILADEMGKVQYTSLIPLL